MNSNPSAAAKRASKAQEKTKDIRDACWPELDERRLWNRKAAAGFAIIPRTIPIIVNIIDALTKGKPAGQTYFVMWCRSFDHSVLVIDNPQTLAYESGFTGERAVTTWKERMKSLVELGFIDARSSVAGPYNYVLLYNPHKVVWDLKSRIQEDTFLLLQTRAIEIGAKDMSPIAD